MFEGDERGRSSVSGYSMRCAVLIYCGDSNHISECAKGVDKASGSLQASADQATLKERLVLNI